MSDPRREFAGSNRIGANVPVLRGVLGPNLKVLFVAFEPGPSDVRLRHHNARRNNQFWRLLHRSGLTLRQLSPEEDGRLPEWGLGLLSAVQRKASQGGRAGTEGIAAVAPALHDFVQRHPPRILAYTGKGVYLRAAARTSAHWGRQPVSIFEGVPDVVLPSPSGKVRMTFDAKLRYYRELAALVQQLAPPSAEGGCHEASGNESPDFQARGR